jgi:hypothetical protein
MWTHTPSCSTTGARSSSAPTRTPTGGYPRSKAGNVDGTYENGTGRYKSTVAEVPVDGSPGCVIAAFSTATDCDFGTRDRTVNDLRLATGVIGRMAVRPAGPPERGPWPQPIVMATVLAAGILLAGFTAATLLVLRVN